MFTANQSLQISARPACSAGIALDHTGRELLSQSSLKTCPHPFFIFSMEKDCLRSDRANLLNFLMVLPKQTAILP